MSPLYLYALLAEAPAGAPPAGLAGEPVRFVSCHGVVAAVGDVAAAPSLDASALRAHDEAVRRLAAAASALLPARFGSLAPDEDHLRDALQARVPALKAALETVRGCDQMTLRFSSTESTVAAPASVPAGAGPGTQYLAGRRAALGDARRRPEVARILDALAPLVRAERLEPHQTPPLLASAFHLVRRDALDAYRATLASVSGEAGVRVTASGPWPPYAFAGDLA
jgi:hypothetical protein